MSGHTKGPWRVDPDDELCIETADGKTTLAVLDMHTDEDAENAKLIAAAPEMLETLQELWALIEDGQLVRNISNDHKSDWALKQVGLVKTLKKLQKY